MAKRGRGRERIVSPDKATCIALGEQMVEWVKFNKPTHISEWYSLEAHILNKDWKCIIQVTDFLSYYQEAMHYIALNARNGTLVPSIAHRFMSLYHIDLKDDEKETMETKAAINAKALVEETKTLAMLKDDMAKGAIKQE